MGNAGQRTILLVLACSLFIGCTPVQERVEPKAVQAFAAKQMFVALTPRPVQTPTVTPTPVTPKPTQTLTPSPRAVPSPTNSTVPSVSPQTSFVPSLTEEEIRRLAPTTSMTFEELVGDNGVYESPVAYPVPGTFRMIIDIYHQVVMVYRRDNTGAYTVPVRFMVCSTGAIKTPTPRGAFSSGSHKVRFGLFVNDGVYGQYWTQISGKIYFHSLLYTKKDAKYYTTSYSKLGQRASHGCVRLLVPDARWIYYHIAPGTEVVIRKGSKEDMETAFIKKNLTRPKRPKTRPKLTPGDIPSTDNWSIATYLQNYPNIVSVG